MECPEQIVVLLREAGWQGYNGWWMHQAKNGPRCRWYEAVAAEMRGDTSSRKRKADVEQAPGQCVHTSDMFDPIPATPELLDALRPKPRGIRFKVQP